MISNPSNFSEQFKNFIEHTATKIKEVEAKADAGGQGTVKSVQFINPDTAGNVDLSNTFVSTAEWQEVADALDNILEGEVKVANVQIQTNTYSGTGSDNTFNVGTGSFVVVYMDSVLAVESRDYTYDASAGTVTFTTTPALGTEIAIQKWTNGYNSSETQNLTEIVNKLYPVGTYYWNEQNVNPSTLFGGTWVEATDVFVLAETANTSVYCWKRIS